MLSTNWDPNAPWNDVQYVVTYKLCLEIDNYTFYTKSFRTSFIVPNNLKSELEELAKIAILDVHRDLYASDFCPDYIEILDINEA